MRISDWSSDVCSSDLLAADRHHEAGTGRQAHLADRHLVSFRRAAQVRVGREAVLRLGPADREVAVAVRFPLLELVAHLLVGNRAGGTVDLLADRKSTRLNYSH